MFADAPAGDGDQTLAQQEAAEEGQQ